MNEKIVFIRTSSGEDEVRSRTAHLSKDIKRALLMVDGSATVAEIMKRSSPSLRGMLADMFAELARGGFIEDKARVGRSARLITPLPALPAKSPDEVDELDFTAAFHVPTQAMLEGEAVKMKLAAAAKAEAAERAAAEQKVRLEAEAIRTQAEARAEANARALLEEQSEAGAARARAERAHLKAEQEIAEAAARLEAERHAKAAELAVRRAEQQAAEVAARARAVAEEKAALEAEVARLKLQAEEEARARAAAEQQARQEADAAEAERRETAARVRAAQQAAEAEARLEAERYARETALAARKAEQHAAEVKAEAEARARAVAEEKSKLEAEVARLKAEAEAQARAAAKQETEAVRVKAEQEARRAREEAEQARLEKEQAEHLRVKAEQEAELLKAERLKAEQEAERVRAEQEALRIKAERELERLKAEQEAERIRAEQETQRIRAEHEAERLKAEQEAERIRAEQETLRIKAEHELERLKAEQEDERVKAEEKVKAAAQERATLVQEDVLLKEPEFLAADVTPRDDTRASANERRVTAAAVPGCDSRGGNNGVPLVERRSTTAAVLFFDIADYAKQTDSKQLELKRQFSRLLNDSLAVLGSGERIMLDTESGAAVGFLQHPTDALEAATHFRAAQIAGKHFDRLRVCIGIHLGPVSLVKDMNGQINMLGDGVNSAQCVMGFAGQNQIYVSRAYFDFVSGLNNEYDELFRYRGSQQDKHGREYPLYELLEGERDATETPQTANHLADFNFEAFDTLPVIEPSVNPAKTRRSSSDADQLLMDSVGLGQRDETKAEPDAVSREASVQVAESRAVEEPADIYSEAEALQLADAQAAKWAEAAQRAEELARKKAETATVSQQPVVAVAKRRRKPVPWGKLAAGLLVLAVAALLVVPAVLPTQVYRGNIERMLGSTLQQPVHITRLSGRILPTPRLVLDELSIGETRQIQVRQAQVNFSLAALFGAVKPVNSLDLDGVEVKALPEVAGWLQQVAGNRQYPVSRINLAQVKLVADGATLADVAGGLDFDAAGKFTQARLNAIGHKLALEIRAAPENKLQLLITLHDSALPLLPNWVFDELKATGELRRDELRIADFDGRVRGGVLTGSARINWRSGWRAQGALVARAIPLQNISKLLSGDLDGTANFQMQSPGLEKLADAAILNGVFSVRKGVVGGVNIVETTRLRSRENLPGGRTYFDALSGELSYANDSYRFNRFQISDSAFKAVGALTVDRQQLSGHVSVDLLMRASSAALQIEGTTESPSLHVAH